MQSKGMEIQNIMQKKEMDQESAIRDIKNKYHLEASNVENQFNLRLSQELHQKEQEHK